MSEITVLRSTVLSKFRSIHAFATALNWSDSKAVRVVNGEVEPKASEIVAMKNVLCIDDPREVMRVFSLS